jgi:hypothetical protein
MNSSAAFRNLLPERRHDYAERLRSTGNVLDSDAESEEIRPYVEREHFTRMALQSANARRRKLLGVAGMVKR